MAAAVLETVIIPRASAFPSAVSATISSSSFSTRRSGSVGLPSSIGLKIQQTTSSSSYLICGSKVHRRAGRIVCDAQKAAVEVPPVKDDTWQSLVLDSDLPVLVEFWAPWCGPCRMIHPVIDELAKEYAGKLKCYKVNTDESPNIATQYGIRSIPTVLIFKDGEKKNAIIGAVPKSTLSTGIENFL